MFQPQQKPRRKAVEMAYIRVKYQSNTFDYVPVNLLDTLITLNEITHFYRGCEKKWVVLGLDAIRKKETDYHGPERRRGRKAELEGG
jgi:hypothetical protein